MKFELMETIHIVKNLHVFYQTGLNFTQDCEPCIQFNLTKVNKINHKIF